MLSWLLFQVKFNLDNLKLVVIITVTACLSENLLVHTCQYFEKYTILKVQFKKTNLALVLDSFSEHNNT